MLQLVVNVLILALLSVLVFCNAIYKYSGETNSRLGKLLIVCYVAFPCYLSALSCGVMAMVGNGPIYSLVSGRKVAGIISLVYG